MKDLALIAAVVVMALAVGRSCATDAELALANDAKVRADSALTAALDSAKADADAHAEAARLDSIARDSIDAENRALRAEAAQAAIREAEAEKRAEAARARASEAATPLVATLTAEQVPLFEEYVAGRDDEVEAERDVSASLRVQMGLLEAENANLYDALEIADSRYSFALLQIESQAAALERASASIAARDAIIAARKPSLGSRIGDGLKWGAVVYTVADITVNALGAG